MGASCKPAPFYYVYRRCDGFVHMVNAGSLRSAQAALNPKPYTYTILGCYPSIDEAKARINDERHADF